MTMVEKQFLVVMGVPSIKKYVFGTDRLREIRGASALLENFNRYKMLNFLEQEEDISSVKPVFTGGGVGQFIISATEASLQTCLRKLEKAFVEETKGGARLNWGVAPYTGANYQQAVKCAELEAIQKNEEMPFRPFAQLHTGFIRECDSCSQMAVHQRIMNSDYKEILCDTCFSKVSYNYDRAKRDLWQDFSRFLHKKKIHAEQPRSFEEIGEQCRAKIGHTALIYADGNSMGKFIKSIDDMEPFTIFSKIVDSSIREACHESLYEAVFEENIIRPQIMPGEILMLGGDDLLVYLTAETAFPFALKVAEKFSEKSSKKIKASPQRAFFENRLGNKGLCISLGIAYGKSHTPFSILLDQAEELLKSAKRAGARDSRCTGYYSPAYIDYHLSSNFNQVSVENTRKKHLELPGKKRIRLYQKPYSLEDAKALQASAESLVNAGISATRLRRLGYAPSMGKMNGTLECLKIFVRSGAAQQQAIWSALARFNCVENIPWKEDVLEDSTMLLDLMELAGFCGLSEFSREEGDHAS